MSGDDHHHHHHHVGRQSTLVRSNTPSTNEVVAKHTHRRAREQSQRNNTTTHARIRWKHASPSVYGKRGKLIDVDAHAGRRNTIASHHDARYHHHPPRHAEQQHVDKRDERRIDGHTESTDGALASAVQTATNGGGRDASQHSSPYTNGRAAVEWTRWRWCRRQRTTNHTTPDAETVSGECYSAPPPTRRFRTGYDDADVREPPDRVDKYSRLTTEKRARAECVGWRRQMSLSMQTTTTT